MKKKEKNYLDNIPVRNSENKWSLEDEIVTIIVVNKGFFNKIAQILFKKPKESNIKLDEYGSRVWKAIDDKKDIGEIAKEVRDYSQDDDNMFYERIAKFFHILKDNNFISFKAQIKK